MSERVGVTPFPLYWPVGWKRTNAGLRRWSNFGKSRKAMAFTVYSEVQNVLAELDRLGARNAVISSNLRLRQDGIPASNQGRPNDPGIAVWFELRDEQGHWHVLACDCWLKPEENLRAIAKHIDALRGQERWGVGSLAQAFRGYQALPETAGGMPWWTTLGVHQDATQDEIRTAFRKKAHEAHPDKGGDRAKWDELQEAYRQATSVVKLP